MEKIPHKKVKGKRGGAVKGKSKYCNFCKKYGHDDNECKHPGHPEKNPKMKIRIASKGTSIYKK